MNKQTKIKKGKNSDLPENAKLLMLLENEMFAEKDIISLFLRMRLHPKEQEEFKKLLFIK